MCICLKFERVESGNDLELNIIGFDLVVLVSVKGWGGIDAR